MYSFNAMCCICLCKEQNLQNLSVINSDEKTHYVKLISCIPEMCFNEMNDQRQTCMDCFNIIETLYKFRQKCLRSKSILINYISKLHSVSNMSGKLGIAQTDLNTVEEVYIKEFKIQDNLEIFLIKNLDENDKEFHKRCEDNKVEVNFIKTDPTSNELDNMDIKLEKCNDELSDDMNEMEHVYLLENSVNFTEFDDLKPDIDIEEHPVIKCENGINLNHNMAVREAVIDDKSNEAAEREYLSKDEQHKMVENKGMNSDQNTKKERTRKMSYECNICKKRFNLSSSYKRHMIIHTGRKPYECNICKKKFTQSSHAVTHMKLHTGIEPYECSVCNNTFSRPSHLTSHMRIHTGEKPYECKICNNRFRQSSSLTRHLRMHTGDKPYECKICHKKFVETGGLTTHMRTHNREKPFECSVCKNTFSQSFSLTRHKRIHE